MYHPRNGPLAIKRTSLQRFLRLIKRVAQGSSPVRKQSIGFAASAIIVALMLALMLWAFPQQELGVRSTLQSVTVPAHQSIELKRKGRSGRAEQLRIAGT